MKIAPLEVSTFESNLATAFDNQNLTCYAIIDKAQDKTLLEKFEKGGIGVRGKCMLPAALDSEAEDYAPYLLELSPLAADSEIWPSILRAGAEHPASFTLLASRFSFDTLWEHLAAFTEILLPDDTDMIFAFWDPAVLGTLTGQASDLTLHVPAPVLSERQRARLLLGISVWWYWDRDGNPQQILPRTNAEAAAAHLVSLPLKLTQVQVDMLVEAGVPDQLLSMVMENQPQLLWDIPVSQRYRVIEQHLLDARKLKIFGMRDILNYTCSALIYADALHTDVNIVALLEQVKDGKISFDKAMEQFPRT
ncbi:hypothetical protein ASD28_24985 [Massilia sp. Root133]|uniref:DUF4123 domain-containing protein n=1 Tax=unclassified Massilia TaxID=2609279 RepID=UPI0006F5FBCA|nr:MULTISPECIES: DUF4123 domain-containing protein [unclassified Massilia]KQY14773.1 hypothetical protein ASD28_24985 [Massilia sp. Root133]KQZ43593.1 hypothetical protein ASD92_01855 [Massilia sp. Root1485]